MKLQSYPFWLAGIFFFCFLTATNPTPAQAGGPTGDPGQCIPGWDC